MAAVGAMVETTIIYIISDDIHYAKEIETVKSKDVTYAFSSFLCLETEKGGNCSRPINW